MKSFSKEVYDLQGSVEDLSSRCQELMSSRESEELGEQLVTLMEKCDNLEGHVAEKEEEFEETLWRWQEFQSDVDTCFRNLAMIEKSLDFQSHDDGESEDRRETHQVRAYAFALYCRKRQTKGKSDFETKKCNWLQARETCNQWQAREKIQPVAKAGNVQARENAQPFASAGKRPTSNVSSRRQLFYRPQFKLIN